MDRRNGRSLEDIAARHGARPARASLPPTRARGTIKKRFDVDRPRLDRGQPPRLSRDAVPRRAGDEETTSPASSSTTRPSARRPRTARRWSSSSRRPASIPGIKVDNGAKPLAASARRDDHRGPRRPARAPRRVLRARRPLRQVARGDRHRPGDADPATASTPTPTRSPAMPRSARKPASCRSSSRKC